MVDNNEWHQTKISAISQIAAIVFLAGSMIWSTAILHETVNTMVKKDDAREQTINDLKERVLRNEIMLSEQGKLLSDIKGALEKFDSTIDRINIEQQKRTSVIDRSNEHLNKHEHGGG